jgi:hypothetical protein
MYSNSYVVRPRVLTAQIRSNSFTAVFNDKLKELVLI